MKISTVSGTGYASNSYVLESDNRYALIDPSMSPQYFASIGALPNTLDMILLTHGHFDHILALEEWRSAFPSAKVYVNAFDGELLTNANLNASVLFTATPFFCREADEFINDGSVLHLADETLTVIHTPGHTRGSCCFSFFDTETKKTALLTGDTLFCGGVGRCDLPGGDIAALSHSIKKLESFASDTVIYSGHGRCGILANELPYNDF